MTNTTTAPYPHLVAIADDFLAGTLDTGTPVRTADRRSWVVETMEDGTPVICPAKGGRAYPIDDVVGMSREAIIRTAEMGARLA